MTSGRIGIAADAVGTELNSKLLSNGIYAVVGRLPAFPTNKDTRNKDEIVLVYDHKFTAGTNKEPSIFVALEPSSFVPLIIAGAPRIEKTGTGTSALTVTLAKENAKKMEDFSRKHLGKEVAIVLGGEIVTIHKVRSVIKEGKLQITRCTDNGCEVLYSILKGNG